jgi:hypothetical protein
MSIKNSNDTIGNRSRDLPVCSAGPQPLRYRVPLTHTVFDKNSISAHRTCNTTAGMFLLARAVGAVAPGTESKGGNINAIIKNNMSYKLLNY